jgi:hypothetical protein
MAFYILVMTYNWVMYPINCGYSSFHAFSFPLCLLGNCGLGTYITLALYIKNIKTDSTLMRIISSRKVYFQVISFMTTKCVTITPSWAANLLCVLARYFLFLVFKLNKPQLLHEIKYYQAPNEKVLINSVLFHCGETNSHFTTRWWEGQGNFDFEKQCIWRPDLELPDLISTNIFNIKSRQNIIPYTGKPPEIKTP